MVARQAATCLGAGQGRFFASKNCPESDGIESRPFSAEGYSEMSPEIQMSPEIPGDSEAPPTFSAITLDSRV